MSNARKQLRFNITCSLRIEVPDREPLIGMMSVVWCEAVEDGYAAGLKAA